MSNEPENKVFKKANQQQKNSEQDLHAALVRFRNVNKNIQSPLPESLLFIGNDKEFYKVMESLEKTPSALRYLPFKETLLNKLAEDAELNSEHSAEKAIGDSQQNNQQQFINELARINKMKDRDNSILMKKKQGSKSIDLINIKQKQRDNSFSLIKPLGKLPLYTASNVDNNEVNNNVHMDALSDYASAKNIGEKYTKINNTIPSRLAATTTDILNSVFQKISVAVNDLSLNKTRGSHNKNAGADSKQISAETKSNLLHQKLLTDFKTEEQGNTLSELLSEIEMSLFKETSVSSKVMNAHQAVDVVKDKYIANGKSYPLPEISKNITTLTPESDSSIGGVKSNPGHLHSQSSIYKNSFHIVDKQNQMRSDGKHLDVKSANEKSTIETLVNELFEVENTQISLTSVGAKTTSHTHQSTDFGKKQIKEKDNQQQIPAEFSSAQALNAGNSFDSNVTAMTDELTSGLQRDNMNTDETAMLVNGESVTQELASDQLAEQINDILREQAWLQGVELS